MSFLRWRAAWRRKRFLFFQRADLMDHMIMLQALCQVLLHQRDELKAEIRSLRETSQRTPQ